MEILKVGLIFLAVGIAFTAAGIYMFRQAGQTKAKNAMIRTWPHTRGEIIDRVTRQVGSRRLERDNVYDFPIVRFVTPSGQTSDVESSNGYQNIPLRKGKSIELAVNPQDHGHIVTNPSTTATFSTTVFYLLAVSLILMGLFTLVVVGLLALLMRATS